MALAARLVRHLGMAHLALGIAGRKHDMLAVAPGAGRTVGDAAHQRAVVNRRVIQFLLMRMALPAGLVDIDERNGGQRVGAAANGVTAVTVDANRNVLVALGQQLAVRAFLIIFEGARQLNVRIETDADLTVTLGARLDLIRAMHRRERIIDAPDVVRAVTTFAARGARRTAFQGEGVQTLIVAMHGLLVTGSARRFRR